MLSYRHGYHAGNFADVFKHVTLTALVQALARKDKPFLCIDTHAGAGRYDLHSEAARKNREYESGIAKVLASEKLPALVASYLAAVADCNAGGFSHGMPRWYPGSPHIALHGMRTQDRLVLAELHSTELPLLQREFAGDRRVSIVRGDGYHLLKSHLPPIERRGLVFIDPSYEQRDEIEHLVAALREGHTRWANGCFAIWYPVMPKIDGARLLRAVTNIGFEKILGAELCVLPADNPLGMNGSGMFLINPPYLIDQQLQETLPWLHAQLAIERAGHWSVRWLTSAS